MEAVKESLGIRGDKIGIFTGAMYFEKGLGFLLEACREIRRLQEDFHMLFLGAGQDGQP